MLLRVYLFALPLVVFFVASLIAPRASTTGSWRSTGAFIVLSIGLLAGFLFARFGNERMDYMTFQDVEAVQKLYQLAEADRAGRTSRDPGHAVAPPLFLVASYNVPGRARDYERYEFRELPFAVTESVHNDPSATVAAVADLMEGQRSVGAYFLLSRGQGAELSVLRGARPDTVDRLRDAVSRSNRFRVAFANGDAIIFELADATNT